MAEKNSFGKSDLLGCGRFRQSSKNDEKKFIANYFRHPPRNGLDLFLEQITLRSLFRSIITVKCLKPSRHPRWITNVLGTIGGVVERVRITVKCLPGWII
ncbi:MAG: hypothetical protein ACTSRK_08435 [Promethearchaeota archaeon]